MRGHLDIPGAQGRHGARGSFKGRQSQIPKVHTSYYNNDLLFAHLFFSSSKYVRRRIVSDLLHCHNNMQYTIDMHTHSIKPFSVVYFSL